MRLHYFLFSLCMVLCFFSSCKKTDKELLIGKWQSDQDWFEYKADNTYNSGKAMITMVQNFKYTIDEKSKELNMYTDEKDRTYYLIYEFIGKDTLSVRNEMSSNKTMIKFYRVQNEESKH